MHLKALVDEGEVPMEVVDEAVRRVLRLKMRLGLFENPYSRKVEKSAIYSEPVLADACKLAEESVVMLKNEGGVLPVSPEVRRILVTGPMADAPYDQFGTWSLDGDKTHSVTPIAALRKAVGEGVEIVYLPTLEYPRDKNTDGFARLRSAARKADVVIAFVGEEQIMSGEAHSLSQIRLHGAQSEMISLLGECNTPLVTVFMAGRPLIIESEAACSDAVLYGWQGGTMAGEALANILLGKANPSGKLPVSFPRNEGQIPYYYNHKHTSHIAKGTEGDLYRIPREAVQSVMGHTSSYLDIPPTPLYPFGFGLSYTTFEISDLRLSGPTLSFDGELAVTVDVENTGKCRGTEVVQLYVGRKSASVTRPMKELKGFARVTLEAGEKRSVTLTLPASELVFCGAGMKMGLEEGKYSLTVGNDCTSGVKGSFTLTAK